MPFSVRASQAAKVSDDFAAAVEAYRQALLNHRHAAPLRVGRPEVPAVPATKGIPAVPPRGVIRGKPAKPGRPGRAAIPAVARVPGTPRPTAHPLIERCIRRVRGANHGIDDFVADYVIVDD
jgi:hypothetical protein